VPASKKEKNQFSYSDVASHSGVDDFDDIVSKVSTVRPDEDKHSDD